SELRAGGGLYDPYHVNSIDQEPNGNLLISARNTDAVYEVDKSTGKILWRLGGKKSNYKMSGGSRFIAQHDARRQKDGTITIFDNGSGAGLGNRNARAIVLKLSGGTAKLVHEFHRGKVHAESQGSMEQLPNGNWFVGWGGQQKYFSEFDKHGHRVYDGEFADQVGNTYRAFRFAWHATPTDPPAIAAKASGGNTKVWASWNGATEVAKWEVLGGPSQFLLSSMKTSNRKN